MKVLKISKGIHIQQLVNGIVYVLNANLFARSCVGHLRALAHQWTFFIALETNSSLALGTRFHIFLLVLSEKRLACFIGLSSRLTVPGAPTVWADSTRP